MQPVVLPRWYTTVAPTLPPGRVLLSYPPPFSGIQSAMAWQAVNRMHYSQAGGAGPEGMGARAGTAAPGFDVLSTWRSASGFSAAGGDGGPARRGAPCPARSGG